MMPREAILEVSNLSVRYGNKRQPLTIQDVSFSLGAGETLGLVGESGSGKSTVARAILGLLPYEGTIHYRGRNLEKVSAQEMIGIRSDLQMVFQDPFSTLDPRMRIGQQIAEPMLLHQIAKRVDLVRRVGELLEQVGLQREMASRYPHEFSGGQRQRIAIARALGVNPLMIVCDEPTGALDVSVQAQILDLLQELQNQHGISYLFIAHNLGVVRSMSHRVAVMHLGKVVEDGPAKQLFAEPKHPYTRALIEAVLEPNPAERHRVGVGRPDDVTIGEKRAGRSA